MIITTINHIRQHRLKRQPDTQLTINHLEESLERITNDESFPEIAALHIKLIHLENKSEDIEEAFNKIEKHITSFYDEILKQLDQSIATIETDLSKQLEVAQDNGEPLPDNIKIEEKDKIELTPR